MAAGTPRAEIGALVLDCDGVLTGGELFYGPEGHRLLCFNAKDGLGLALLCRAGVKVGVLSGRPVDIATARLRELGVEPLIGRCRDKGAAVRQMCADWGVAPAACAFVGDDLPDLPAFAAVGLCIAVADAVPEVAAAAHWRTQAAGGRGAVREICEGLLKARGPWPPAATSLKGERHAS